MVKAVLDTNVVVSAHLKALKAEGREALILELALAGKFKLCASDPIFEEYEGVLTRPRFGFDPQKIARSLKAIRKVSLFVRPRKQLRAARDPDDDKFLECTLEAGAEYLVTGNLRHFPVRFRGTRVVSPREFLVILAARIE